MRRHETASDQALIDAVRTGDRTAYAVLWSRHSGPALTVARSFTSLDADDVVAEAFSRIYAAIRKGAGPTTAFRPYLFTTVRNVAARWGRAATTVNLEDVDALDTAAAAESDMLDALDRSTTAQAFRSLPDRWQEVLWYTEVEGMAPRQVGALLGMTPNSVSALAVRAREGLRQAWIGTHLASTGTEPECTRTIERLPAYARGTLGARPRRQVYEHLATCDDCRLVADEANHLSSRIALVLLPLTLGAAAAAAYQAALGQVGTVAAVGALTPPSGGSGSGGLGSGSLVTAGVVGAGILVVAGIGVSAALVLGPSLTDPGGSEAGTGSVWEATKEDVTGDPPWSPAPVSSPPTSAIAETLAPVAPPVPAARRTLVPTRERPVLPSAPPVPPMAHAPGPGPTPVPTPSPGTVPPPSVVVRPVPSEVFPELTGTAERHAVVTLTRVREVGEADDSDHESSAWTTISDSSGAWSATLSRIRPGNSQIVVTQAAVDGAPSPPAPAVAVTLDAPPMITVVEVVPELLSTISVSGRPERAFRWEYGPWFSDPLVLDSGGHWDSGGPVLVPNPSELTIRYVHEGRVGAPGRP